MSLPLLLVIPGYKSTPDPVKDIRLILPSVDDIVGIVVKVPSWSIDWYSSEDDKTLS